jgi:hypothetical protein
MKLKNSILKDNPTSLLVEMMNDGGLTSSKLSVESFRSHYGFEKLRSSSLSKFDDLRKSTFAASGDAQSKMKMETLAEIADNISLTDNLLLAYLKTDYEVFEPSLSIKIGKFSVELDELLNVYQAETWAYITPFNPFSMANSSEQNEESFECFQSLVKGYKFFLGAGKGENPTWAPEKSLLILGISFDDAELFGFHFGQNAIVVGKKRETAKLMIHLNR